MKNTNFDKSYEEWKDSAYEEFRNSEFYNGEKFNDIEICENGTVHLNFFNYINNVVTPWKDSDYYTEA